MNETTPVTHGAQDYYCADCDNHMPNVRATWSLVPEVERTYKGEERKDPVHCDTCGRVVDWQPRRAAHDLMTGGTGIHIDIDGTEHNFSSAHEMRAFAAESQKRAANGEGQAFSFRALEQNRGNMDRNTLAGSQFETNRQTPHENLGRTSRDRKIGRGVMTREQAERAANHRS